MDWHHQRAASIISVDKKTYQEKDKAGCQVCAVLCRPLPGCTQLLLLSEHCARRRAEVLQQERWKFRSPG